MIAPPRTASSSSGRERLAVVKAVGGIKILQPTLPIALIT
jgi:hypothetical protein